MITSTISDITVFLSLTVFQKIVMETLPEVSTVLPVIGTVLDIHLCGYLKSAHLLYFLQALPFHLLNNSLICIAFNSLLVRTTANSIIWAQFV